MEENDRQNNIEENEVEMEKDITQEIIELKQREKITRDDIRHERFTKMNIRTALWIVLIVIGVFLLTYLVSRPLIHVMDKYKDHFLFNLTYRLDENFKGKFEIVSPQLERDIEKYPDVEYQIKGKYDIVFKLRKTNESIYTDYDHYLYRQYVMDYIKKNNAKDIVYGDSSWNFMDVDFYVFDFGIKIDDYTKIDYIVKNRIHDLYNYIYKRACKDFNHYVIGYNGMVYINDFSTEIKNYYVLDKDEAYCANYIKSEYIKYLIENNLQDENVPKEDYEKYNIPEKLKFLINGVEISNSHPHLDYTYMDYFVNIGDFINSVGAEDIVYSNIRGYLSFSYKGKKYKYDDEGFLIVKGNRYPSSWLLRTIKEVFDVEIEYNIENGTANLITK